MNGLEAEREKSQKSLDEGKSLDERRRHGQFATPYELAREIVSYGLDLTESENISFLEPAAGTGAFLSALTDEAAAHGKTLTNAMGVELDGEYAKCAGRLWTGTNVEIINGDFTRLIPDGKYNLLVTNPPYVRHHYIAPDEKLALRDAVRGETGVELSGLSDLFCYFILLSRKWLDNGAVCGWLIPSEFMDVNYGGALKDYLLNGVRLLEIHRYDPADLQFGDALVSSCVVWFRNEIPDGDYEVEFTCGGTLKEPTLKKMVRKSVLAGEEKWSRFPGKDVRGVRAGATIGDLFTIKRGLVTGDNSIFVLTKDRIDEMNLDMRFFRPVLPSPRHLKTNIVETKDTGDPVTEPGYYLLDCELSADEVRENHPVLWKYLMSGVPGTSTKYLCRGRKEWFRQERRTPARFLCSYMGRGSAGSDPIRFILNLSEAVATNSYLMLYPKEPLQKAIERDPSLIYLVWEKLKSVGADAMEDEGRVYGGGLKKIEPSELAKVSCQGLVELIQG